MLPVVRVLLRRRGRLEEREHDALAQLDHVLVLFVRLGGGAMAGRDGPPLAERFDELLPKELGDLLIRLRRNHAAAWRRHMRPAWAGMLSLTREPVLGA